MGEEKLVHYKSDVPNFVGSEAFKGSNYGPARYLSERRKRFRMMNPEELKKYDAKFKASKGFDVDGCTGCLPGRIHPLPQVSHEWDIALSLAKFASEDCADLGGPTIKFANLEKANVQPVQGGMYYLTFTAEDTADNVMKTYRAKVWLKAACQGMKLMYFREFKDPKKRRRLLRRKESGI